ncbi:hypothetical protein WJN01_08910 [Flavobacteriaceae bacterium SZ-1-7]|uniref:hypothetical protein n=1 Tax=Tamlana sedimenti TaxID=3134126 RepID=UPI003122F094
MGDLNSFISFFNKNTINKIGEYFSVFIDLYIKPLKSWKRIISQRKTSLEYFIIYILFYSAIVYLISWDLEQAITKVFLTLILTLIPFLLLLIPFLVFTKLAKKRIKANRLYRLLVVFEIQLLPLIHFPNLVANWGDVELPYLISSNFLALQGLLCMFVLPLIIKINVWKKLCWIMCNYILVAIFGYTMYKIHNTPNDLSTILEKADYYTPKDEFGKIWSNYKKTDWYLDKDMFYVFVKKKDSGLVKINKVQFSTTYTSEFILQTLENKLNKLPLGYIKSIRPDIFYNDNPFEIYNKVTSYLESINSSHLFEPIGEKELNQLDSLQTEFNKIFYHDIKFMDSLQNYAKYKSNREYASYVSNYISQFDSIVTEEKQLKKLIETTTPYYKLKIDSSQYILAYNIDKELIKYPRKGIEDSNIKLYKRYNEDYYIIANIIFYPLNKLINYLNPSPYYLDEFKHINERKENTGEPIKFEMELYSR